MGATLIADRYELLHKLGRGAMANVFLARDQQRGRDVAIKLLNTVDESDEKLYYFQREARAAAALKHPGIIQIFDYSPPNQKPAFIVMEVVEGIDLKQLIKERAPLAEGMVLLLLYEVARAIAFAHGKGVIHRDIKPGNVMVAYTGRVCLSDFGLAKAYLDPAMLGATVAGRVTGLAGTPSYMAPEQVELGHSGPESDVFSFGCMVYALAAGYSPFAGSDLLKIYRSVSQAKFTPLDRVCEDLAPPLVKLIHGCLSLLPSERPKASEVASTARKMLKAGRYPDPRVAIGEFIRGLEAGDVDEGEGGTALVQRAGPRDDAVGTGTELVDQTSLDPLGPGALRTESSTGTLLHATPETEAETDLDLDLDLDTLGDDPPETTAESVLPATELMATVAEAVVETETIEEVDSPFAAPTPGVLAATELYQVPTGIGSRLSKFAQIHKVGLLWGAGVAILLALILIGVVVFT